MWTSLAFLFFTGMVCVSATELAQTRFFWATGTGETYTSCETLCATPTVHVATTEGYLARSLSASDDASLAALLSTGQCGRLAGHRPNFATGGSSKSYIWDHKFAGTIISSSDFISSTSCVSGSYCNFASANPSYASSNTLVIDTTVTWNDVADTDATCVCLCELTSTQSKSQSRTGQSYSRPFSDTHSESQGPTTPSDSESPSKSLTEDRTRSKSPSRSATVSFSSTVSHTGSISRTGSQSLTSTQSYSQQQSMTRSIRTPSISRSFSQTNTASLSNSSSRTNLTATKSHVFSISETASQTKERSATPTATPTPSNVRSKSNTVSSSPTNSSTPTKEKSTSKTGSVSPTRSSSLTQQLSSTVTNSSSVTETITPPPTPTPTVTFSETSSKSFTRQLSRSFSVSHSQSPVRSVSMTHSRSRSRTASLSIESSISRSKSDTLSRSSSTSITGSSSRSTSTSLSTSASVTRTQSSEVSFTKSLSRTSSMSGSKSLSVQPSTSFTTSQTLSISTSATLSTSSSLTTTYSTSSSASNTLSTSKTLSFTTTSSVSSSMSNSITVSASTSQSQSVSSTLSLSQSTSVSTTQSQSMSTTLSVSQSTSVSTTQSQSMSTTLSLSQTSSVSTTQSQSVSTSYSLSQTSSVSFTVSSSLSFSISPTLSVSDEPSSTSSESVSSSETRSISLSETATLSPVWPEALSVTVAQTPPFFTVDGVPVFNFTGNQSLTIYPRLANGADFPHGFYRHPQPPFYISLEGPATIVAKSFQCTLSLPCTMEINPSYDWWVPALLTVQYDNTYGPYTKEIEVIYQQGPTAKLEFVYVDNVVEEMSAYPEFYIRGIDSDGRPTTYFDHVNITVTLDNQFTQMSNAILTGKFTPPLQGAHTIRVLPTPPPLLLGDPIGDIGSNYTILVNASTTSPTSIEWGIMEVTILKCAPAAEPVLILNSSTSPPVITFSLPFSLLTQWVSVECLFEYLGGAPNTTIPANQSKKCYAYCEVPTNATRVYLYIDHQVNRSRFMYRDLPFGFTPRLIMVDNQTANLTRTTWNDRLGCVKALMITPWSVNTWVSRKLFFTQVTDVNVTLTVWNGNDTYISRIYDYDVIPIEHGWMICNAYLPGSSTWFVYEAVVDITVTLSSVYTDMTPFILTAATNLVHVPDTICRNRYFYITPPNAYLNERRIVSFSRPLSPLPWHFEDVFIDNSTSYVGITALDTFYVILTDALPSLRRTQTNAISTTIMALRTDFYIGLDLFLRATPLAPTVLALEGCLADVYPSAVSCHSRGTTPLTIHGFEFNATHNISFEFLDNPTWVPCLNKSFISSSLIICHYYPGFGSNGSVVMHDPVIPGRVYSKSRGLLTFAFNVSSRCPYGANGLLCSGRGSCDALTGTCICFLSLATGYWGGSSCSTCHISHNSSDNCILPCPTDSSGAICSGRGWCQKGTCWCGESWSYTSCPNTCPGVGTTCSGNGICDGVYGVCNCTAGFAAPDCATCVAGLSGAACDIPCPMQGGLACSGNGQCVSGGCFCNAGWCGTACELSSSPASNCAICPVAGLYGASCTDLCPGASVTTPCSGHGTCNSGRYGNGVCSCINGFGTVDCSTPCPVLDGIPCAAHGTCDSSTAVCRCDRFFGGPACTQECPADVNGAHCSNHGVCNEGSSGTGRCICNAGYSGEVCNSTCSTSATPCSGHGTCDSDSICHCFADPLVGYWDTVDCSTCAYPYSGPECNGLCPTTIPGMMCSGHGNCSLSIQCECYSDPALGFWGGPTCGDCAYGYYGSRCTFECPAGACNACSGRGTCYGGNKGNGTCSCYLGASTGYWAGSDCSICAANYFTLTCSQACPSHGGVFCPNGRCDDGTSGAGGCVCNIGFQLNSDGVCLECKPGYFGPTCLFCPSVTEQPCSGRGVCDDGRSGTGLCRCTIPYAGKNCSYTCPVAPSGKLCGRGYCVAQDFCACETGYQLTNGTCTLCIDGLWGPNCEFTCPMCSFGVCTVNGTCNCNKGYFGTLCDRQCPGGAQNPCSGHGTCDMLTGACSCYASSALGYYIGFSCSSCDPLYLSDACNMTCPVYNDVVCNNRGACYNGVCTSCSPLENETLTQTVRCGTACQFVDQQCFPTGCPIGFYGTVCNQLCPAATVVSPSSTCSGHGLCTNNGTCVCSAGYFGFDCSSMCPADVNGSLCSSRGTCLGGVCQCTKSSGSYGRACELPCPGGYQNPCLGRGLCSASGVCLCENGYWGFSCDQECPGGAATPCLLNGQCSSTGICACHFSVSLGYFSGSSCERCADQFAGPRCLTPCPASRGVVVGRACVCKNGFVGDDCSKQCGSDAAGNPCSAKGVCMEINAFAQCVCNTGYFGELCDVPCDVAMCQALGFYRPACTAGTGSCSCQSSSNGRWTGAKCDECEAGFWGVECTLPCSCSNHGTCNQISGSCNCFASPTEGFWDGVLCDRCLTGYIGDSCTFVNVEVKRMGVEVHANPNPSAAIVPITSVFDPQTFLLWISDPVSLSSGIRVLQSFANGSVQTVHIIAVPSSVAWFSIANDTDIQVILVDGSVHFYNRVTAVSVQRKMFLSARRHLHAQASQPSGYAAGATFLLNGELCDAYIVDLNFGDANMYCPQSGLVFPITDSSVVLSTIDWIGFTINNTYLIIAGTAKTEGNWAYVTLNGTDFTGVTRGANTATKARGLPLQCFAKNTTDMACILRDPVRLVSLYVAFRATTPVNALWKYSIIANAPVAVQISAISRADIFDVVLVAMNPVGGVTTVYTFTVSTIDVVSSIIVENSAMAVAGRVDTINRLALLVLMTDFSVTFTSYNLMGIKAVTPTVIDENGGALVTVEGSGFFMPQDGYEAWCDLSGSLIPATVISSSLLTCTSAKVSSSVGGACQIDYINIIFDNPNSTRTTSNTHVGIFRPTSAVVSRALTARGDYGYGSFDTPILVSLIGFGFVDTPNAHCRLVRARDNAVLFISPVLHIINSSVVTCMQPPTAPSAEATAFQYSHDGAYYSVETFAPYMIVGPTTGVNASAQLLTVVAGLESTIPMVQVFLMDAYGNRRLDLESIPYRIRVSTLDPVVQIAGNAESVTFGNTSIKTTTTVNGVATFDTLVLLSPSSGSLKLNFFSPENINWQTSVVFQVVPGAPAHLSVARSSAWRTGVLSARRIVPAPVVVINDAAGNVVTSSETFARVIFTVAFQLSDGSFEVGTQTQFSTADSSGAYSFNAISMRSVFDTDAFMVFSVGDVPQLRIFVPQETCVPGTEYAVTGTFDCSPCPANSVCDGTSTVDVNPGYWRSAMDSFQFYPCTPESACPGGTGCTAGYQNIMCAGCDNGFGRSQGSCVACLSDIINWLLVGIIIVAFIVLVYYLSIFAMTVTCCRDGMIARLDKKERNPFSIVVKITLSYLQMLTLIPYSRLNMPSWMKNFLQGSATASKFNPNLSFVGCVVATNDVEMLVAVLLLIPIAVAGCIVISVVAAYWRTYRSPDFQKAMAELSLQLASKGSATTAHHRFDLAKAISRNKNHFDSILKTHHDYFGATAEDNDVATEVAASRVVDQRKDMRERVINMFFVSLLVALFFLFPTIVQSCAGMLSCTSIDMGEGKPMRSVLTSDPSVDCSSAEYQKSALVAVGCLIGLGAGIPLLNFFLVHAVRILANEGDLEISKMVFFFSTGGYREDVWFWESISMGRKLLLATALTVFSSDFLRLLTGLWVLIASVLINISFQPWNHKLLSLAETTTLGAIAITYGLVDLTFFDTIASSDTNLMIVYAAMAAVNLITLCLMAFTLGWSTRKTIQSLAKNQGSLGQFIIKLQHALDPAHYSINSKNHQVSLIQKTLKEKHTREYMVALAELAVAQLIDEYELGKNTNLNAAQRAELRHGARPRLPAIASFMSAVDAMAVVKSRGGGGGEFRIRSRTNSGRSSKSSDQGTTPIAQAVPNPLAPPPPTATSILHTQEAEAPRVTFIPEGDENEHSLVPDHPTVLSSSSMSLTKVSRRSWFDNQSGISDTTEESNGATDHLILEAQACLAVLKRSEGYTAMRLRHIVDSGEAAYGGEIIDELYEAEFNFFKAAVELRECIRSTSQLMVL